MNSLLNSNLIEGQTLSKTEVKYFGLEEGYTYTVSLVTKKQVRLKKVKDRGQDQLNNFREENKMENLKTQYFDFDYDLECGFAFFSSDVAEKRFQVCLVQKRDRNGYKKQIRYSDCGYNEGICYDVNKNSVVSLDEFIKVARKNGIKII